MMRIFSIWVPILILSFVFSASLNAQILKWVDKNGTTHYGDRPSGVKDYEVVDDSNLITYSKQSVKKRKSKKYRRLPSRVVSPKTGQQQQQYRTEGSSSSQQPARGSSSSRY
jgi:hypothetical protein